MASGGETRLRLVLFGEQRSGTTLLSDLLDAQPGVTVAGGYLGPLMYCAFRELALDPRDRLSARQRHVLGWRLRTSERGPELAVRPEMPSGVQTFDELHARLLGLIAKPGDRIVGHKIHGPIEALPALLEIVDVRCIYLIRDVRDVLLSRSYRGEDWLDEPAATWLQSAAVARAHALHERMLTVRFEDLVLDPTTVLDRLARWLGIDITSAVARSDDGRPALQNSSFGELMSTFDARAVQRFRAHRESKLVRFAQWRCRDELRAWGYPLDSELDPSLSERLEFTRRAMVIRALDLPRRAKNALLSRALPSLVRDD